jgi:hypothetical protein
MCRGLVPEVGLVLLHSATYLPLLQSRAGFGERHFEFPESAW